MTEDEMMDGITDLMGMSLSRIQEMVKDMEAWCATVYGVTKNQIQLSNQLLPGIPWMEEPGRLQSMGSLSRT